MRVRAMIVLCLSVLAGCSTAKVEPVIPQTATAPTMDGRLDDPAWQRALVLADFSLPQTHQPPPKPIEARLAYDARNLYLAVTCAEPDTSKLVSRVYKENDDVWTDDCIEVYIRTQGNSEDYRQFIVNPSGIRGWFKPRQEGEKWQPAFIAKTQLTGGKWRSELTIPFADLGISTPSEGDLLELKIGRHDQTGKEVCYYVWPAGIRYSGPEDYGVVYFGKANLLTNPALDIKEGQAHGWTLSKGAADGIRRTFDGGTLMEPVSLKPSPTACQQLALKPNSLYRLEAMVKGRLVMSAEVGEGASQQVSRVRSWRRAEPSSLGITFETDSSGKAQVKLSLPETKEPAEAEISNLTLRSERAYASVGPYIPLDTNASGPLVVRKLLFKDCRAMRGFVGSPTDGTENSWGWDGGFTEHNRHDCGQGVGYFYRANDGLHLRLEDANGFNAVIVRGGVRADVYRDCPSYDSPDGGTLIGRMPGKTRGTSRLWFDQPVRSDKVSLWNVADGYVADISFLRVQKDAKLPRPQVWAISGKAAVADLPDMAHRFTDAGPVWKIAPGAAGGEFRVPAGKFVHLVSEPLAKEMPLSAIGLTFAIDAPTKFSARIQDPIDPRRELCGADFELALGGPVKFVLDHPDQILPAGSRIWLSLQFDAASALRDVGVELYTVPREQAAPEAFAYRKYLLRGLYSAMSEARPWGWYSMESATKFLASDSPYAGPVREILCALDHCRYIGLPDDDIRQYHEWMWRNVWTKEGKMPPFETKFDLSPGAPKWACLARQAWLQCRKVPTWWLDNRLVTTGEFGGVVGDDSDMYQNYADFPMLEDGPFVARLKDAAMRLQTLAEQETMTNGVNRVTMDPLHAYEEGLNHESLMAFWNYGDPVYLENCMAAARSLEKLTIVTPKGHRHFRSENIGLSKMDDPSTDKEIGTHPLMWHPVFELVRYNRNAKAMGWLKQWGDGWMEHMAPGAYADEVKVATETVVHKNKIPYYGTWGGQGAVLQNLYMVTGDRKYVQPYFDVLKDVGEKINIAPGSIISDFYLAGDFDTFKGDLKKVLAFDGVATAAATGDKSKLCEELTASITELQRFPMMYTYVECFTDRVFMGEPLSIVTKTYTGGFQTRNKFSRTHAVSYEGLGTDFAALVLTARPNRFRVLLYNFADKEIEGNLRLWTLHHGKYRLRTGIDEDPNDNVDAVTNEQWTREEELELQRGGRLAVKLPSKKILVLDLTQTEALDDILQRADLALSGLDCVYKGSSVEGFAHNIGVKDVADVAVALVDASGKVMQKRNLGPLAAPNDLMPRKVAFKFENLPAEAKDWTLVLDIDNAVPEINKDNNRLALKNATGRIDMTHLGGPGATVKQP